MKDPAYRPIVFVLLSTTADSVHVEVVPSLCDRDLSSELLGSLRSPLVAKALEAKMLPIASSNAEGMTVGVDRIRFTWPHTHPPTRAVDDVVLAVHAAWSALRRGEPVEVHRYRG